MPYSEKDDDDFVNVHNQDLSRAGTPIDTRACLLAVSRNFDSLGFEIAHKSPLKAPGTANQGSMRKFKVIKAQTIGVRRESQHTRATLDNTYKSNEGVRRSGNQISSAYSVSAYGDIIVRPKSRDEFSHPREMS